MDARCAMSSLGDRWGSPRHAVSTMMQPPDLVHVDLLQLYESAEASNSLLTDMVTASFLNTMSDSLAQATVKSSGWPDGMRTARFSIFGFMDGAMSHAWFGLLYAVLGDGAGLEGQAKVIDILLKQFAEALVYTPYWALWFLCAFSLLEGRTFQEIPQIVREKWRELFVGTAGFFFPVTLYMYACVPQEKLVLAYCTGTLIFTIGLSIWNGSQSPQGDLRALDEANASVLSGEAQSDLEVRGIALVGGPDTFAPAAAAATAAAAAAAAVPIEELADIYGVAASMIDGL